MDRMDLSLEDIAKQRAKEAKAQRKPAPVKKATPSKSKAPSGGKAVKAAKATKKPTKSKGVTMKVVVKTPRASGGGGGKGNIMSRLGAKDDRCKVLVSGLTKSITMRDMIQLCDLVTKNVDIEMVRAGAFDLFFDRIGDAKRAVKRFDGELLDGKPMRFKLDDGLTAGGRDDVRGRQVILPTSGGRNNGKGRPVAVPVSKGAKGRDGRKAVEKEKKVKAKAKPAKKEKAPREKQEARKEKSAAELDAEMESYFAGKAGASAE